MFVQACYTWPEAHKLAKLSEFSICSVWRECTPPGIRGDIDQGYVMERRIYFIEEGPEGQSTTHFWHSRQKAHPTLPYKGSCTHLLQDYSRHLHFSTSTRLPLNKLARRHMSASSEIRVTTALKDGVAPSKTMSFRCRHGQQTRVTAIQRSRSLPGPPRFDWSQGTKLVSVCGIQWSVGIFFFFAGIFVIAFWLCDQ
jgi:hypothetical protein